MQILAIFFVRAFYDTGTETLYHFTENKQRRSRRRGIFSFSSELDLVDARGDDLATSGEQSYNT